MASYPKIWTTILFEDWFVEMSCLQRGVYLQLLLLCKLHGDNGQIYVQNWTHLAHSLGVNRRTCGNIVTTFAQCGKVTVCKNAHGLLLITIPKYVEYQQMRTGLEVIQGGKTVCRNAQQMKRSEAKQNEAKSTAHKAPEESTQGRVPYEPNEDEW